MPRSCTSPRCATTGWRAPTSTSCAPAPCRAAPPPVPPRPTRTPPMSRINRRDLFVTGAALGGAVLAARRVLAQPADPHQHHDHGGPPAKPTGTVRRTPRPTPQGWQDGGTVITPNGARLPWKVVDGVKVFHLFAEPVEHTMVDGLVI